MVGTRQKLIGLLDYVEQVVRLDERVAFSTSEYRLPDGSSFAIGKVETQDLPGIRHNLRDEEGPVWLEVERLARKEPPTPPKEMADWIKLSADPAQRPEKHSRRMVTVSAAERDAALAKGEVRAVDIMAAPRKRGEPENAPPRFDLTLRLDDRPAIAQAIEAWIDGAWTSWSAEETPRRRTISLYQSLYKVFQLLEVGVAESPIELIWGVGVVYWQKDNVYLERPLLERRVEIELDDGHGGLIRVRPTGADAIFDPKPYEELGCTTLVGLSDLVRREIHRAGEEEGVSPFNRESFEPILSAAGSRLDQDGCYAPDIDGTDASVEPKRLTVTDQWVLFARPRSQHLVLQDIDRLRRSVDGEDAKITGLAERLVTEPSNVAEADGWEPLSPHIGGSGEAIKDKPHDDNFGDVFFPKPFNDDQIEIVGRLFSADGLVVQGPPGTGKTHTIANLICHNMATGKKILVVSRGEAALAVLKDKLPKEVQPLAISVLSNERQGLRQIEGAIREIQSVVESTRPESRRTTISRIEREIQDIQGRTQAIDDELDKIAAAHLTKMGPRGETPAELAQRVVAERDAYLWFVDRPLKFAEDTGLADKDISGLRQARGRLGEFIDHLGVELPDPSDLPDVNSVASWHDNLIAAAQQEEVVRAGPVRAVCVTAANLNQAMALAGVLEQMARVQSACAKTQWIASLWRAVIEEDRSPLWERLRERIAESMIIDAERGELLKRAVTLPNGVIDNEEARAAIERGASGHKPWPLITIGKSEAKALVSAIRIDSMAVNDIDVASWRHVAAVVKNMIRQREADARWDALAGEIRMPSGEQRRSAIKTCQAVLRIGNEARAIDLVLGTITAEECRVVTIFNDQNLCLELAKQIRAAASATQLAVVEQERRRVLALFADRPDRTSTLIRNLLGDVLGKPSDSATRIATLWASVLKRLEMLKARRSDFDCVKSVTGSIATAGAPIWAGRLRKEAPLPEDPILPSNWRDAWDHAAADANLSRIDQRERLNKLAHDRDSADERRRKLFGELVRERTFYELDRRLSPSIKSALVEFVRALTKIGKGTGKSAWIHRRAARDAMARCYGAVPCWIMPTWRVAEQLPPEFGAVDLVIIDEASQSDITELPALLRGKKLLVVGDDRQVSPTAPFVTQQKVMQLSHHYLGELPFKSLLEPGDSVYDLMRAVFPNERLMLKEHFRCVEPIIRFSMQFYPEKMVPLRIPSAQERFEPPLVDIYIPHGQREKTRKINRAEAKVIVEEIAALTKRPEMRKRTIGVISLIGAQQAEHIRAMLSETVGEEIMHRHAILCGDSATFQGTERDIVFLSMVADPHNKTALTMLRYEQRFNVAVSRARDRAVLVRSVRREDLNPNDLKARLITHFENPMPAEVTGIGDALSACESNFERDLLGRLLERGYRVQPQVGSLGYRIDMVAEGLNGNRLAIECDGDRYHGPEQWQHDMRRQRVLERVGWRFWRCFASSFYRDTDAVLADLIETLSRMGIEPGGMDATGKASFRYSEHRVVTSPVESEMPGPSDGDRMVVHSARQDGLSEDPADVGIGIGDKVVLIFSDNSKRMAVRLRQGGNDLENGFLSISSPLGKAVIGAEEGDEIEIRLDDGRHRKALIESVEKAVHYPRQSSATSDGLSPLS